MATYLIGNTPDAAEPVSVQDLADELKQDPETSVVKLIESSSAPPLLIVDMPAGRAQRLMQAYEGRLSIEPDAPLSPFS